MNSNSLSLIDPTGELAFLASALGGAAFGTLVGGIAGGIGGYIKGGWGGVLKGAGYGAVRGFVAGGIAGATFGVVNPGITSLGAVAGAKLLGGGALGAGAVAGGILGTATAGGIAGAAGEALTQVGENAIGIRQGYSGTQIAVAGGVGFVAAGAIGGATSAIYGPKALLGGGAGIDGPLYIYSSDPIRPGGMVATSSQTWGSTHSPGPWLEQPGFGAACTRFIRTGNPFRFDRNAAQFTTGNTPPSNFGFQPVKPTGLVPMAKALGGQACTPRGISGFERAASPPAQGPVPLAPTRIPTSPFKHVWGAGGFALTHGAEAVPLGFGAGLFDPDWYAP